MLEKQGAGAKVDEVCCRRGASQSTFYSWPKKNGGLVVSKARRLQALEDENTRLKSIVADQTLDIVARKDLLAKSR